MVLFKSVKLSVVAHYPLRRIERIPKGILLNACDNDDRRSDNAIRVLRQLLMFAKH